MVRPYLGDDKVFLANYADGVSNLDLAGYLENFERRGKIASFVSVAAPHTFHIVDADSDHHVRKLEAVGRSVVRVNGGFFAFKREIFDYIKEKEDLVLEPFDRLIAEEGAARLSVRRLLAQHGHVQGQDGAGRDARQGSGALAGLEATLTRSD